MNMMEGEPLRLSLHFFIVFINLLLNGIKMWLFVENLFDMRLMFIFVL